jgi:hypothetical protein
MPATRTAPQELETQWGYLGFVKAGGDGFTVRFGIDQERYFLPADAPNYNALYSLLLSCWLARGKLSITYTRSPASGDPNGPFTIQTVDALPPGSDGD